MCEFPCRTALKIRCAARSTSIDNRGKLSAGLNQVYSASCRPRVGGATASWAHPVRFAAKDSATTPTAVTSRPNAQRRATKHTGGRLQRLQRLLPRTDPTTYRDQFARQFVDRKSTR